MGTPRLGCLRRTPLGNQVATQQSAEAETANAARAAINASGQTVMLTARAEAILRQAGGLPEALRRLAAYAEAGADRRSEYAAAGIGAASEGDFPRRSSLPCDAGRARESEPHDSRHR